MINILPGKKYGLKNENIYCDKHYMINNNNDNIVKSEPTNDNYKCYNNDDTNNNNDGEVSSSKINSNFIEIQTSFFDKSIDNEFNYLASTSSSALSTASSSSSISMSPNLNNNPLKFDFSLNSDQKNFEGKLIHFFFVVVFVVVLVIV